VTAQSDGSLFSVLPGAAVHPLPLLLAAGTVAAAFVMPLLAIPGAAAWAVATGAIAHRRTAKEAEPDISSLPPSLQADLLDVTTALDQLQDAVRSVPDQQRPIFEGIERESEEVRESVVQLAVTAGALHRHIEAMQSDRGTPEAGAGRRERLLARLERYRATLQSLEDTAQDLTDRALDLAAGGAMGYDEFDEQAPERKITEMKASMAAIEEVMQADTEQI
jgi:hypothetical protein